MGLLRFNRIKMTAPAVVVLATVVNAAIPGAHAFNVTEFAGSAQRTCSTDLGWAVQGGATHSGQATRAALARKAASDIRSMELVSTQAFPLLHLIQEAPLPVAVIEHTPLAQSPKETSHQHSAP